MQQLLLQPAHGQQGLFVLESQRVFGEWKGVRESLEERAEIAVVEIVVAVEIAVEIVVEIVVAVAVVEEEEFVVAGLGMAHTSSGQQ